ncbi:MAG: cob(I)yrinic acid a,c-diamide adenosyltransferase [Acidimicrobiales bacterium]
MTEPPVARPQRTTRRPASLVVVNTGDGKGKTTAAMGTVLRALDRGWRVSVVQFVKSGRWASGEARLLSELGAEWHVMGDGFTWDSADLARSAELARAAWELAREAIASGDFDLVLLDEVTYPVNWEWIEETEVIEAVSDRPAKVNVILTGRDAPSGLVAIADTVSEMRNVKHAFDAGLSAIRGIDF